MCVSNLPTASLRRRTSPCSRVPIRLQRELLSLPQQDLFSSGQRLDDSGRRSSPPEHFGTMSGLPIRFMGWIVTDRNCREPVRMFNHVHSPFVPRDLLT